MNRFARLLALSTLFAASLTLAQASGVHLPSGPAVFDNTGAFGGLKVVTENPIQSLSFRYNLNTEKVTTSVSNGGAVSHSTPNAVLTTGTATNGSALMAARYLLRYTPGQGIIGRFTTRFVSGCVAASQQEAGFGNTTDGFYFGCVNGTFGIIWRNNSADTFIPQSTWSENTLTLLDITKGNVYTINYQWLGYGVIKFYVEDNDGTTRLVHRIKYSNANTLPSLTNPALGFRARVLNNGNATNLTMHIPSAGVFAEGPISQRNVQGAAFNTKTAAAATRTNILTLRNNSTFQGLPNTANIVITAYSVASDHDVRISFYRNATLGGSPNFVDFDSNTSVVAVDTAGTTVTNGRNYIPGLNMPDQKTSSGVIQLTRDYRLAPGDTLTVEAFSAAGSAITMITVAWDEEF